MTDFIAGVEAKNQTAASVASLVVIAQPGRLLRMAGYNGNVATRYIQLHDATSLPANATVPAFSVPVAAGAAFDIDFGVYGRKFRTGIVIANSTTGPTLTAGSADMVVDAQWL
jgi:hypothetical protein